MTDESQITIPPSFIALYLEPGRTKPNAPRDVITTFRHEHCHCPANMLTARVAEIKSSLGVTEGDVRGRIRRELAAEDSTVDAK